MIERRALAAAPCAILPVTLVFIIARALFAGDWRELFAAPFSALLITLIGYPIALAVGWLLLRIAPSLISASVWRALVVGAACAEISFWFLVAPFWEREFSDLFCAALMAGCGAATAAWYRWRLRTSPGARTAHSGQ